MSQWFQFGLGRLFACVSVLCLATLVFASGVAEARGAKCGNPAIMGFMEAWVISGAGFGLLAKSQAVGVLLGVVAGIVSLSALMMLVLA